MGFSLNDIPILGDIGPKLPVVGPLLFEEPGLEDLQRQMQATAQAYEQMRLPMQQARFQGLNAALGQFAPAADMLGQMYGPQFRPPTQVQNPFQGPDGGVPALGTPENLARFNGPPPFGG